MERFVDPVYARSCEQTRIDFSAHPDAATLQEWRSKMLRLIKEWEASCTPGATGGCLPARAPPTCHTNFYVTDTEQVRVEMWTETLVARVTANGSVLDGWRFDNGWLLGTVSDLPLQVVLTNGTLLHPT